MLVVVVPMRHSGMVTQIVVFVTWMLPSTHATPVTTSMFWHGPPEPESEPPDPDPEPESEPPDPDPEPESLDESLEDEDE
jgi:hypothetical protein